MDDAKDTAAAVRGLYARLIAGWNERSGASYAAPLSADAEVVGFDGSVIVGRDRVAAEMQRIFEDHRTARYVAVVKSIREPAPGIAVLRAAVGMVPPGASAVMPERNAWHIVVGVRGGDGWELASFQSTPAQFHGRPQALQEMTEELSRELGSSGGE